ncbi:Bifunctional purine biosynthesis protein PurH [uncultured archaeon]|nr:Bifunctional purine biosynthesis protein PurH [uncultured archaeon]
MTEAGISPIVLVVVNLYPFEEVASKGAGVEEAIENIDIGGPSLIRAAAKNHESVAVVTSPAQYDAVITELEENKGELSVKTRANLAISAFQYTSSYDAIIYDYLSRLLGAGEKFPAVLPFTYRKVRDLRYGENPHQQAAFYRKPLLTEPSVTSAVQRHGVKQLSFNNILDLNDALELVREFSQPAAAVIKHTNPCGVAIADSINNAYKRALGTDPTSAYGGVVGLNRVCDAFTAEQITATFIEAVIAPGYTDDAIEVLKKKPNLRVMDSGPLSEVRGGFDIKKVVGGLLVQDRDVKQVEEDKLVVKSKRAPTKQELVDMIFAWKVNRHVKSNAIVLAKDGRTTGIGAGQMSRVDAVKIAVEKSHGESKGSALASDAFFPFRDGVDEAAKGGVTAVIHPGGSIRDGEVIASADEHNIAMVFTGIRCFKH